MSTLTGHSRQSLHTIDFHSVECIETRGKPEINARRFLDSKAIKALLGEGYTPDTIEIEREDYRGRSRFNALTLEIVTAYWLNQASQGNQQAVSLIWALLIESLERRFDSAFGVSRTEQQRDERLRSRIQEGTGGCLRTRRLHQV